MTNDLCADCKYATFDETGIGQRYIDGCRHPTGALAATNCFDEIVECDGHTYPDMEDME